VDQQTSKLARLIIWALIALITLATLAMAVLNWMGVIPVNHQPL